MKKTKIILALVAMVVAASAVSAQMKITQAEFLEPKAPLELKMSKENVQIAFDMELERGYLKQDEACIITPMFVSPGGSVQQTFPAIILKGRDYAIIAREKSKFDKAVFPVDAQQSVYETIVYGCSRHAQKVHYQISVPAKPAFKGASLMLNQKTYNTCCMYTGRKDKETKVRPGGLAPVEEKNMLLANGVTDYSEFAYKNPVLYYYPNSLPGRYENNFSNNSVFKVNKIVIDMDAFVKYGYTAFEAEIKKLQADKDVTFQRVQVNTAASPEGPLDKNKKLAEKRADAITDYLVKNLGLCSSLIEKRWVDENWEAFMQDLAGSGLDNQAEIRGIVNGTADLDQREKELRKLKNWKAINEIFQNLRNCYIVVDYLGREKYDDEIVIDDKAMAIVEVQGKKVTSLEKTTEFFKADPTAINNINNMMVALTEAGRYKDAVTYAEKIPNRGILPVIANNKGVLYTMMGDPVQAQRMFELGKGTPMVDYNMGLMYLYDEKYDSAADLLDSYNVGNSIAANLSADRSHAAAMNTYLDPPTAQLCYLRAIACANDGRDDLALDALEEAVKFDPACKQKALNQADFFKFRNNSRFVQITGSKATVDLKEAKSCCKAEKKAANKENKAKNKAYRQSKKGAPKEKAVKEKAEKAPKEAKQAKVKAEKAPKEKADKSAAQAEKEAAKAAKQAEKEAAKAAKEAEKAAKKASN